MQLLSRLTDRVLVAWHERALILKAISFGMVGVINTIVDATIFFVALATLTSSLVAANLMAWTIGVTGSYIMNSYFTFAHESGRKLRWRAYLTFAASSSVGAAAATTALVIAAQYMPVWAAKACAIGVSFLVNFSMSNFVVFRKRHGPQQAP